MTRARKKPPHYAFDEVRAALHKDWGLSLHRGGDMRFDDHDGRWDVCYSRTGYIIGGHLPGIKHNYHRFTSLSAVVQACNLVKVIAEQRTEQLKKEQP